LNPKLGELPTENSVLIRNGAKSPHTAIFDYYSGVLSYTEVKPLHQWLGTKSFEEQIKFGKDIL
jgi:hypothetical protein